jgi:hypothetical protein
MTRRTYQLLALLTLPLPVLCTFAVGVQLAKVLPPLGPELPGLFALLAYSVVLLVFILAWAVALLPLRRRAGFKPLSAELDEVRRAGGLGNAVAARQKAMAGDSVSDDPSVRGKYHLTFAAIASLMWVVAGAVSWALWESGYIVAFAAAAVLVCPVLALYHGAKWLRTLRA